ISQWGWTDWTGWTGYYGETTAISKIGAAGAAAGLGICRAGLPALRSAGAALPGAERPGAAQYAPGIPAGTASRRYSRCERQPAGDQRIRENGLRRSGADRQSPGGSGPCGGAVAASQRRRAASAIDAATGASHQWRNRRQPLCRAEAQGAGRNLAENPECDDQSLLRAAAEETAEARARVLPRSPAGGNLCRAAG